MKIIRAFEPGDRYHRDFDHCSYTQGWAQVDSIQGELGGSLYAPCSLKAGSSPSPAETSPDPNSCSACGDQTSAQVPLVREAAARLQP